MARNIVDFITAPSPDQLVAADVDPAPYTGPARPSQAWFDGCRAVGHNPPSMIYETVSTWSQGGYQAGADACVEHEARANERGHTGSMMVVVSDGSAHDPNYGYEHIRETGRGWSDRATKYFYPYGNVFCCQAFNEGADAGAGAHLRMHGIGGGTEAMIPETWGFGSIASQLVGGSPIPGTDLDIVHIDDLSGGGTPSPAAPDLFVLEVPLMTRSIQVNGIWDTFFVGDDDKLYWIHANPKKPDGSAWPEGEPHVPVVVTTNADAKHPDIDIVPTGYGPVITLRAKTAAGETLRCMRVLIKGWAYVAEYI